MTRRIALDTETTGLSNKDDRIIEIGAVEIIDNKITGNNYHVYLNPQKQISFEATKIHGITNEQLVGCPLFKNIADEFLDFIKDSELLIHNAAFDIKMLNAELARLNKQKLFSYIRNAHCTLEISKRIFPDKKQHGLPNYKLDSICDKLNVDRSDRILHGALLDANLLAQAYIKMSEMYSEDELIADLEQKNWTRPTIKRYHNIILPSVQISQTENANHEAFLNMLETTTKVEPIFKKKMKLMIK